jgi:hypothetical protein
MSGGFKHNREYKANISKMLLRKKTKQLSIK